MRFCHVTTFYPPYHLRGASVTAHYTEETWMGAYFACIEEVAARKGARLAA